MSRRIKARDPIKGNKFATVCGRIFRDIDPCYYPAAPYRDRRLLFCTDACRGAFLADPDLFYKVHRNSEKGKHRQAEKL